ncbi:hypothetical protein Lste_0064 [Legionella steelei]|uniref:Uncharacterized protein n=1 Tax=Legionella steelei TaxID=947033 RepID=A0A0W0ZSP4_9GAMM|nr:hypothetical protein Lste_0064 [Legionella steelei]
MVLAKKKPTTWCNHATNHAKTYNGKPWHYLLIPHDEIAENNTMDGFFLKFKN